MQKPSMLPKYHPQYQQQLPQLRSYHLELRPHLQILLNHLQVEEAQEELKYHLQQMALQLKIHSSKLNKRLLQLKM